MGPSSENVGVQLSIGALMYITVSYRVYTEFVLLCLTVKNVKFYSIV